MWVLRKTPQNFTLMTGTSWGFVYKLEMVPLSVSLFWLRFVIFPVSVLIFRIVLVMLHEATIGNLLDFLTYKILLELPLAEFRAIGKSVSFVSRHSPNTSEHPSLTFLTRTDLVEVAFVEN